ncbi:unnamed protein product [Paramecium primaurelia]|uniref:Uncharacterized protein n=1 Tax=Paramecium primaurelia TaxID=5886 RepID=A0A8S1PU43_PARPR|nr:unnamed protein product [Paramecium primaurelia]
MINHWKNSNLLLKEKKSMKHFLVSQNSLKQILEFNFLIVQLFRSSLVLWDHQKFYMI